ncbi:MAG TPA: hypothetical protein VFW40_09980 [Capsulimonadaceae bacterium]|nr:hypothetical protein [Capsulimonadaceae bacterium]
MSRFADILLTLWILFVAVVYFGGSFSPAIGASTQQMGKVYAAMLIVAAIALCWRWLTREQAQPGA